MIIIFFYFYFYNFRYTEIFSELVLEISSRINLSFLLVAESIASALYEVCYLKADESLNTSSRWEKQKEREKVKVKEKEKMKMKERIQNADRYERTSDSVKKQTFENFKNKNENITKNKSVFLTYDEQLKLKKAIKLASKCLSVCWKICGSVLNNRKKNIIEMKMKMPLHEETENFDGKNVDNKYNNKDISNSNINNDVNITTNNLKYNNLEKENKKMTSTTLDNNKNKFQSFETSYQKSFNQKNNEIICALLSGMNSPNSNSNFKPSIAFTFIPPPLSSTKM